MSVSPICRDKYHSGRLLRRGCLGVSSVLLVLFLGTAAMGQSPTITRSDDFSSSNNRLTQDSAPDTGDSTVVGENSDQAASKSLLEGGKLELPNSLEHILNGPDEWTAPSGLVKTLQIMLLLTVLSVAPAILLMTTSFIRVLVVLGLLRQALGTQQLPPSQVITSLAMFITVLIMTPVWTEVYESSVKPYRSQEISWSEAWTRAKRPIANFMGHQIEESKNTDDIWLLYDYYQEASGKEASDEPAEYDQLPLQVLIPAYILSELKTAFLIGFQVYLPFLVLDIVIASVTISMGMLMLPPVMISLPFKVMLFVLVDGWHLVVSMLINSFGAYW